LGKLKTKRKHASKFLQRETIGKQKKVETKERNGLPDAATCIKNREPESNTWKAHLLGHKPSSVDKAKKKTPRKKQ
jgi:hypothetical protein